MEYASLLADGTAIIRRICDHPYGCHYKFWHYYNGVEHSIFPTRTEPQIIATDSITETTVYGKYSFGRSEGWRYRTFSYDFRRRRFQFLNLPPVVATLTKDVVVCYPEQTTVKGGDYDTHSTGDVWAVNLATGRTKRRRWGQPGRNPSVAFLPPYIVDIQPYTTRSSKLLFFDANLNQQNAFPELNVDFCRIDRLSERMLLLVPFDRKEHVRDFWLVTREDSL
jgi:hypothetical protein